MTPAGGPAGPPSGRPPSGRPPSGRLARQLARARARLLPPGPPPWRAWRRLAKPPPRVRLHLAPALPGAVVRLLPGAAVLAAVALLPAVHPAAWVLGGVAAAAAVRWPRSPAVPLFGGLLGVLVLTGPDLLRTGAGAAPAGPWRLAGLMLALHLAHRATALAAHTGARARVEMAVLAAAARSVAPVQLAAQALLLVSVRLRGGLGTPPGGDGPRAVALLATLLAVFLVVPWEWRNRRGRAADSGRDPADGGRRAAIRSLLPWGASTDR